MQTNQTVKINPDYDKMLPKIPAKEYEALKESIKENGQQYPIIINSDGTILDGHNRFRICQELGIVAKFEEKNFATKLDEKEFVIISNLRRRHLSDFEKAELASPLIEIEAERARLRQQATQLAGKNENGKPVTKLEIGEVQMNTTETGKARDIIARSVGLSPTTFQRSLVIMEKGDEKLKDSLRRKKTSITYAYNRVQRREKHEETPELPKGTFDVIYADPPWKYDFALRGDPESHYQVMETEDICKLKVPVAENAILFLWSTNPKLEDALKVIKAWGFEYKTNIVWVKDKFGTGYYVRAQHELLLIAKRGAIPAPAEETRPSSVVVAIQQEHSQKPLLYDMIESMYPNRQYVELFATVKRHGWVSWGLPKVA